MKNRPTASNWFPMPLLQTLRDISSNLAFSMPPHATTKRFALMLKAVPANVDTLISSTKLP
jgi:hypothetical protein